MNTILKKTFILSLLITNTFFASLDSKTYPFLLPIAYTGVSGISGYMAYTFNKKARDSARAAVRSMNALRQFPEDHAITLEEKLGANIIAVVHPLLDNSRNLKRHNINCIKYTVVSITAGLVSLVLLKKGLQECNKQDLTNASCQLI
jgi:hypothetical protein